MTTRNQISRNIARARSTANRNPSDHRRSRISILPYGPSDSVRSLKDAMGEILGQRVAALRIDGSTIYRGRSNDIIVNWGNSRFDDARALGTARVLNSPEAIRRASMKTEAMAALQAASVPTVEFTTDQGVAGHWLATGSLVYARTVLQGHSGEGIVMAHRNPSEINGVGNAFTVQDSLPQARLYTKGILVQRREFRIHVVNGTVTYVQQKKRADGAVDRPEYSNVVRNYHTGWIYASSDVRPNDAALRAAVDSVAALGLDFGAVDVITRRDDAWVLEVNTAPGLQGTNLSTYAENFCRIFRGEEVVSVVGEVPAGETVDEGLERLSTAGVPIGEIVAVGGGVGSWGHPVYVMEDEPREVAARMEQAMEVVTSAMRFVEATHATAPIPAPTPIVEFTPVSDAVHESFYEATLSGVRMIVQYNAEAGGFYMPGWEIPMTNNEDGLIVDLSRVI